MLQYIENFFRGIRGRYELIEKRVLLFWERFNKFDDQQLKEEVIETKRQIIKQVSQLLELGRKDPKKEVSDKFIARVYALVREVILRKKDLLLYPTQILGGIALHYGNIAQMNTGEGKTLTAILPACLNALVGETVFVTTVNEYLANRDWEIAKEVFDFFEINSSVNIASTEKQLKKEIYNNSSIIYSTANELGFDFLRNNVINNLSDFLNIKFDFAIIDEADKVLLDDSNNPLAISRRVPQKDSKDQENYRKAIDKCLILVEGVDYQVNSAERTVWLLPRGVKDIESYYEIENLFDFSNNEINFILHNCLKAINFFKRNIDYIVSEEKIRIIDSSTGRIVKMRVYPYGIQQAIEAKEGVRLSDMGKTFATITYQNLFRKFRKVSAMTGTASGDIQEFNEIYGMNVIVIPPHKKLIRKDRKDLLFATKEKKYQAVVSLVAKNRKEKNRPILIGTPDLQSSEDISVLLTTAGFLHNKLNAVNYKEEAEIISKAGLVGQITIATNMAGRGTDIILSPESIERGGLILIGLGRNSNRRVDDQLKGRVGRQGNPGDTQFYISLEDDLLKEFRIKDSIFSIFGKNSVEKFFGKPISGRFFNLLVQSPQESSKNISYSNRQTTLDFDLLINRQRKMIYDYREVILKMEGLLSPTELKLLEKLPRLLEFYQATKRRKLLAEIDNFWTQYLESLSKLRSMLSIKVYLPRNSKEAFFLESSEIFLNSFSRLKTKVQKILSEVKKDF